MPQGPCSCIPSLARLPRDKSHRRRQFARRSNAAEPLRRPVNLTVGVRRNGHGHIVCDHHPPHVLAGYVFGNDPPHELRASRAIGRDSGRASITVRAAVIERAEAFAPIGWNIEHPQSARYSAALNFIPQMPALTNYAWRISNLSGGCKIFRPPLADLIPDNFAVNRSHPFTSWGAARLSETSGCGKLNRNRR